MRKVLVVLFLLSAIMASSGFVAAEVLSWGPDSSYFNTNIRYRLAHYPELRHLLKLRDVGDARADYLGARYDSVKIAISLMEGEGVPTSTLSRFAESVAALTHKETSYEIENSRIPYSASSTEVEIRAITSESPEPRNDPGTAILKVFFLEKDQEQPKLVGLTHEADAILIFQDALRAFTAPSPATFADYQFSTLLHEFGHQLGLEHNTLPGCLMNEHLEMNHYPRANPQDVVMDFCTYEKDLLAHMQY